jgi:hypothetical protein
VIDDNAIRLAQDALRIQTVLVDTVECYQQGDYRRVIQRLSPVWMPSINRNDTSISVTDENVNLLEDATLYIRTLPTEKKLELMSILYMVCVTKLLLNN